MKITLILNGKTEDDYLIKGISAYEQRLKHYVSFETIVIPALKNKPIGALDLLKKQLSFFLLLLLNAQSFGIL